MPSQSRRQARHAERVAARSTRALEQLNQIDPQTVAGQGIEQAEIKSGMLLHSQSFRSAASIARIIDNESRMKRNLAAKKAKNAHLQRRAAVVGGRRIKGSHRRKGTAKAKRKSIIIAGNDENTPAVDADSGAVSTFVLQDGVKQTVRRRREPMVAPRHANRNQSMRRQHMIQQPMLRSLAH